jgi:hypothetical protein
VFGVGSTAGMLALSGLIGLPFALSAGGSHATLTVLRLAVGVAGTLVGGLMVHGGLGG